MYRVHLALKSVVVVSASSSADSYTVSLVSLQLLQHLLSWWTYPFAHLVSSFGFSSSTDHLTRREGPSFPSSCQNFVSCWSPPSMLALRWLLLVTSTSMSTSLRTVRRASFCSWSERWAGLNSSRDALTKYGHTLDLILARTGSQFVTGVSVSGLITDHHLVLCSAALDRPVREKKIFSYRDYKAIDQESLEEDIILSCLLISEPAHVPGWSRSPLSTLLSTSMRKFVMWLNRTPKWRPSKLYYRDSAPWINASVLECRCKLRKAERIWRSGGYLDGHFESYKDADREVLRTHTEDKVRLPFLHHRRMQWWPEEALQSSGLVAMSKSRALFSISSVFTQRLPMPSLPSTVTRSRQSGLNWCSARESLDPSEIATDPAFLETHSEEDLFTEFSPVSVEDVRRIIICFAHQVLFSRSHPDKVLRKVARLLTPAITSIVNLSLQSGVFPSIFKHGLVTPLLKKPGLDKEDLSNYRPITNLSFVSKVLERIVSNQLDQHLSAHNLLITITICLPCSSLHWDCSSFTLERPTSGCRPWARLYCSSPGS